MRPQIGMFTALRFTACLWLIVFLQVAGGATLISTGAVWKYLDNGSNQETSWRTSVFDDSAWASGPAQLGYGDGDEATVVSFGTNANNKYITTYFRRFFDVEDASTITNLTLELLRDDGAVLYLNGVEIFRSNMPTGAITSATLATVSLGAPDENTFIRTNLPATALLSGSNLLAVEIHQAATNSGDLSFNLQLSGNVPPSPPSVAITSPANNATFQTPGNITISASASDSDGTVQLVEFYSGSTKLGQDGSSPYSLVWPTVPAGSYTLTARATDTSGSMATSAPVQITVISSGTVLIPAGSVWAYLDKGVDGGTAWREVAFDHSGWTNGQAQLGYGDGDEITVVSFGPDPNNKYTTTYFRKSFVVTDPSAFSTLVVDLLRDDGAVGYLNGTEIFRSNMPGGTVSATTFASSGISGSAESAYFRTTLAATGLVPGTNVMAVEVHQNDRISSDLSFDLELRGTASTIVPQLVRGPYLQMGTTNGAIIRWRTDVACNSKVQYGTDSSNLDLQIIDSTITTEHVVALTNLSLETKYFYSIGAGTNVWASGTNYYFVTAPPIGEERTTRLWILGDSGTANQNARNVRDGYTQNFTDAKAIDVWLMLGDNAYNTGTDSEYQAAVFNTYPNVLRNTFLWPAIGNHDSAFSSSATSFPYLDIFTLPTGGEVGGYASGTEKYYSFDYANIHFICLDSMTSSRATNGAMLTWLENDLAATTQPWIIAYWHHPPYTKGSHNSDTESELIQMRQNALPILEAGGVDLILCGHSHCYERSYLLNGHYGSSSTINASHKLDDGSGREDDTGSYQKLPGSVNSGVVYAVAGASGQVSGGPLNHPAMYISLNVLGSMVLDVSGERLDAKYLGTNGNTLDYFTIIKTSTNSILPPLPPSGPLARLIDSNQVEVTWIDNSTNETAFLIERSIDNANFTQIADLIADSVSFTNTDLELSTTYFYRVRGTNAAGNSPYSDTVSATTPTPATVLTHPTNQIVNEGGTATFSVVAAGTSPLFYQWMFNGTNLIADATNDVLVLPNVQDAHAGSYAVVVNNGFTATSSNASLTINHLPVAASPTIARAPSTSGKIRLEDLSGNDPDGDVVTITSVDATSAGGGSVRSNSWVIYTPPAGYGGVDTFNYTIADSRGGQATGTVSIVVVSNATPSANYSVRDLGGGSYRVDFAVIPERTYLIEYTETLTPPTWSPLHSGTADSLGVLSIVDTPPNGSPARSYRSREP